VKRPAIVWALVLAIAVVTGAQDEYVVAQSTRLPAQSYVGDQVELRLLIRTKATLTTPAHPPAVEWGTVDSVRVAPLSGDYEVRILLTPFEPGALTVAPLDLGGIELSGVTVHIGSILDNESRPAGVRGQLLLPGTRGAVIGVTLALVIGGVGALVVFRRRTRLHEWFVAWRARRRPRRRFDRAAGALHNAAGRLTADEFYSRLVQEARGYMSRRFGVTAECLTTSELTRQLPELIAGLGAGAAGPQPVLRALRVADRVRFAGEEVAVDERIAHLERVAGWVAAVETEHRRRRRLQKHGEAPSVDV
jgi:hypothetical protein